MDECGLTSSKSALQVTACHVPKEQDAEWCHVAARGEAGNRRGSSGTTCSFIPPSRDESHSKGCCGMQRHFWKVRSVTSAVLGGGDLRRGGCFVVPSAADVAAATSSVTTIAGVVPHIQNGGHHWNHHGLQIKEGRSEAVSGTKSPHPISMPLP